MNRPSPVEARGKPSDARWLVRLARRRTREEDRQLYLRPLLVSMLSLTAAQIVFFVAWGLILSPGGSVLAKLTWMVLVCGIGMGAVLGVAIDVVISGRLEGVSAIVGTVALTVILLGVVCNGLCFVLDRHVVHMFHSVTSARSFLFGGVAASVVGGLVIGTLLHSEIGRDALRRVGL